MAPFCKCEVVDAAFGNIELANYSFNRILSTMPGEGHMESRPYLGIGDLVTRRRTLQHDHVFAAWRRRAQMCHGIVERTAPHRFVDLGQLSGHSNRASPAARRGEVDDGALDAMRRLVHHNRAWLGGDCGKPPGALAAQIEAGTPRTRSAWCRIH